MITKQENPTRKGQELELEIESLAYGGLGLAKLDDFVVFVKGGLPGQTVLGHIYKKKRGYSEAYIVDVLKESPKKIKETALNNQKIDNFKKSSYYTELNQLFPDIDITEISLCRTFHQTRFRRSWNRFWPARSSCLRRNSASS